MFNRIFSVLKGDEKKEATERFERVQVATCALLLEVAHSDGHYQSVEAQVVHQLLSDTFDLPEAMVTELIDYSHQHREQSTDLFQFAREINAHFSREEKADVMEGIWQIIYADGTLDKFEDTLARQLASLLRLDHKDVIERKMKVINAMKGDL